MSIVTKRIAAISPSLTLAITAKAKAMKAEGKSVIGFGAGEPDFNTPQHIIDAAKDALDKGYTKYTPSSGLPALRAKIAEKLKAEQGLDYDMSQIVVSSGAKHSIFNAMFALVEEGDEVIIPAPYWLTYPEVVKVCGGKSVFVEGHKENHFKISPEDLKKAITPKTKVLVFNSPSNPTGAVYTEEEIRAIGKVVEEAGIWVISDEIYSKLIYDGVKFNGSVDLKTDINDLQSTELTVEAIFKLPAGTKYVPVTVSDGADLTSGDVAAAINAVAAANNLEGITYQNLVLFVLDENGEYALADTANGIYTKVTTQTEGDFVTPYLYGSNEFNVQQGLIQSDGETDVYYICIEGEDSNHDVYEKTVDISLAVRNVQIVFATADRERPLTDEEIDEFSVYSEIENLILNEKIDLTTYFDGGDLVLSEWIQLFFENEDLSDLEGILTVMEEEHADLFSVHWALF